MTFEDFQKSSNRTAVYHETLKDVRLQYLTLAIAGEGGSLAAYVKKFWKHGVALSPT